LRDISDRYKARIVYFGEIFSSLLIAECFKKESIRTTHLYSRSLVSTDNNYLNGTVDMKKTRELCQQTLSSIVEDEVVVVTGFV